jgi:hypothetical protein
MPNTPFQHLTDAQFTDLLMGSAPAAVTAHLDACSACAQEAQRVSAAIGSFAQHSAAWAERRAVASRRVHPAGAVSHQSLLGWLGRPVAWSAVAATLVLAGTAGLLHRNGHMASPQSAVIARGPDAPVSAAVPQQLPQQPAVADASTQPAAKPTPATLKADNELLSAIDGELRADSAPAASLYGLDTGPAQSSRPLKRTSN